MAAMSKFFRLFMSLENVRSTFFFSSNGDRGRAFESQIRGPILSQVLALVF